MDKFIMCVVTDKLTDISELIDAKQIDHDDYYKLYNYFFYFYSQNKLSDRIMYFLSYLLIHKYKVISTNHIYDFEYLLAWHIFKKKTNNKTFTALNLYNNITVLTSRINSIIDFLKTNSKNLRKLLGKHKKTSKLKKIIKHSFIDYMVAFNDKIIQNNIMIGNMNNANMYVHDLEIEKRLIIIIKYFGINLLQLIGVDIIDNRYFWMLTFEEKTDYYKKCINIISDTGKNMCNLLEFKKRTKKINKTVKNEYLEYEKNAKKI